MNKEDIVLVDAEVSNYKDALECAGQHLFAKGYVKKEFAEECFKREQIYPTGLPTVTPVAIPHCDSKFVIKESLCVLRLKNNVDFYRIDDSTQMVSVPLVFNLAIKKDEGHVLFLQKLITALGSEEGDFVKECMTADKDKIADLFEKYQILM